jgi:hypothetical protein
VYNTAGIASFQLSFVNIAVVMVRNNVGTVVFEGRLPDISCNAIVKLIASLITSFKKTLVLAWYLCPPVRGITLE